MFPFRDHELLVFGGAFMHPTTLRHALVDERVWLFNLQKLEWSLLPSLSMVRPMYFHAAAMNDVSDLEWPHFNKLVV